MHLYSLSEDFLNMFEEEEKKWVPFSIVRCEKTIKEIFKKWNK